MPPANDIFLGLDLGLRRDPSALIAVERQVTSQRLLNRVTYQWEDHHHTRCAIVHAEHFALGTPFPEVTARAAAIARHCAARANKCLLAMDATGLGLPLVHSLRSEDLGQALLLPVTITDGGRQHSSGDTWKVPKPDLVAGLSTALENRQLSYARGLNLQPLFEEMRIFGARLRPSGHTEYSGRKDDLVLALCLALWASRLADHGPRPVVIPGFPGKNWIG